MFTNKLVKQLGLIQNNSSIDSFISLYMLAVRTRFGLNPKTGMDPGPQSPCNKFVECRVKKLVGI